MFRLATILLSVAGLMLALWVVATAKEPIPSPPPAQPPSTNPFQMGIVALGLVEPASRPVNVAAPEAGRVTKVFVEVNDVVKQGDPLFELDGVPLEAELLRAEAARSTAQADVERLANWPRKEDLPPAEAEVAEAAGRLADAEVRLASMTAAATRGAASDDELTRQRFQVSILRAAKNNAEARLARLKSGSWEQDLLVARANLAAREADIRAVKIRLERMTVRAPIGGTILRRHIDAGEFAQTQGGSDEPPLVMGDISVMHVRAQIDEEDAPLLTAGATAVARVRGPIKAELPLEMVRIEPFARPKSQISGASTELVDTRVIEVVFRVKPLEGAPRIFTGQVLDVYVDASAAAERFQLPTRVASSAAPVDGTQAKQ